MGPRAGNRGREPAYLKSPAPIPPLHLITDDAIFARPDFEEAAESLLEIGRKQLALHLRAHGASGAALFHRAQRLGMVAARAGSLLLVNDRVDVALAAGCQGVHLGVLGMPVEDARRLIGPGRVIGASVHSLAEARAAVATGADFLIAGTIYPTSSHPGRAGLGPEWLAGLVALGRPVIAIGGISPERVQAATATGAAGVAVVSGVWEAEDPSRAVLDYLAGLGAT